MVATRRAPDAGNSILPFDGQAYQTKLDDEISGLWARIAERPSGISGTNDVLGTVAASDVTVMAAYGPVLIVRPVNTNTGPVRINIDGLGLVSVLDSDGNALTIGEFVAGRDHALVWDPAGSYRLVANGSAPAPTIARPGPLVIDTQTVSGGSGLVFTIGFDDTYDHFTLHLMGIAPATDDTELTMQVATGAGFAFQTAGYVWTFAANYPGIGFDPASSTSDSKINMADTGGGRGLGNAANKIYQATVEFNNPEGSGFCEFYYSGSYNPSTGTTSTVPFSGSGRWNTAGPITGARFQMLGGNMSGTGRLVGWPKV